MRSIVLLLAAFVGSLALAPDAHAAPQKKVLELAETLDGGTPEERVASAQSLAELGKRAAKATPALVRGLAAEDPTLVDACVTALVAVGGKARPTLAETLESGAFEGAEVPPGPVARALLQMGKKAEEVVDEYVATAAPGPELFALFEEFGDQGARFLIEAAAGSTEHAQGALRSLRRLASREVRSADTIEPFLKRVEDEDLARAVTLSWTQTPTKGDARTIGRWIAGEPAELVETGLWCAGVVGRDAGSSGDAIVARLDSADADVRRTALWALASLAREGPGAPTPAVAASFPGGSKKASGAPQAANESNVFTLWRDSGKSLGYRGRVGNRSRELWALAPSWTGQVEPFPKAPDRAALPKAMLGAESKLVAIARDGSALDAALASSALSAAGASSEAAVELWGGWLASDDPDRRREALIGLRAVGRAAIAHEAAIVAMLQDEETRIAAAQVLTAIATPTAWSAVVEAVAAIEGKPPYAMLLAISRYDAAALRPGLDRFRELYRGGHYMMAAFLIRFGDEVVADFAFELGAGLADRRMVAAESLGHLGAAAKPVLPKLEGLNERHPVSQKLVRDAVARIKASS